MKERLIWLDSLKGWLILIVILGHAIQYCLFESLDTNYWWNLIYSFHMPAFMAASGFVNYRSTKNGKCILTLCKRRSLQLLVPYLLWSLAKWSFLQEHTIEGLVNIAIKPDGYFWFLWVLWVISITFIVGEFISQRLKLKQELTIVSIALILVSIMVALNFRMFGFQFIAYYFMFYAFGYYCNSYRNLLTSSKVTMVVLFAIWLVLGSFWNMHELPFFLKEVPYVPAPLLQYSYRFTTAFVAIYLIFSIAPLLLHKSNKLNKNIVHLGQISLGIYVVHLSLIIPLSPWLVNMLPEIPMPIVILLSFVITSILSVIIVELLNKNKFTSKYLLGKL